jgi:hypothetical protein
VVVEDVDVVGAHAGQRRVEAVEKVLAGAQIPVRPGPVVPAGLRGDDELFAVREEVLAKVAGEVLLGRPVRRAVVVGQVEVGDAEIEGAAQDVPLAVERHVVAEVVPQAQRHRGQHESALADPSVRHAAVVAARVGVVRVQDRHG